MVAQTDLIGVVPRVYAEQIASTNGIQFFDLPVEMSNQSFHMIWHKRADMDAGLIWLRDQVASCFSYDAA
jgi:DNA-binding transcriptional LysR family regulator